jgi:uncharacterized protein YjbI with pentapeptide repeats/class 3 adenylate cyclase
MPKKNSDQTITSSMIQSKSKAAMHLDPIRWPKWKQLHKNKTIRFKNEYFHQLELSGLDFSNVHFIHCHFDHCNLHHTRFISSDLTGTQFLQCDFSHAQLIAARLDQTAFQMCLLHNVNFLTAIFKKTMILETNLSCIDLQSIDLRGINLECCDLRNQNLKGKDLTQANLKKVDLRGANLSKAIFNESNLSSAQLGQTLLSGAQFKNANLHQVDLSSLDLSGVNFESANLSHCNFSRSDLSRTHMAKANITGAILFNINSAAWDISGIICQYVYWDQKAQNKTVYKKDAFERIYAESITIYLKYDFRLTTIEMTTLPILIEHLQACFWGVSIGLRTIKDVEGGAWVQLVVDETGSFALDELESALKEETSRIQKAQLLMRSDKKIKKALREAIAGIKDQFWPRLLELASEYETDQIRNFSVLFIDLKGFTRWNDTLVKEKLSLFRGLLKPILAQWHASYPNMEGDSLRATFKNAYAAVECAWMIRDVLMAAQFELRIGIDLGPVSIVHNEVTEHSDLEGHAVSMASRLESMANPGEVIVSEKVKHYAEQQTSYFVFKAKKAQLIKSIGQKSAGDWIDVYYVDKIIPSSHQKLLRK